MDPQFEPLMDAAYRGDLAEFRRLLGDSPDLVSERSSTSHPTLFQYVAVEGGLGKIPGAVDFARVMIESGAQLEEPLVAAASVNASDIVESILDAGAPIEACAPWTPLEESLYWAHQDMAAKLLARGAQVRSLRAAACLGDIDRMRGCFSADGTLQPDAGPVRFPFGDGPDARQDILDQAFILALKNRQYAAADLLIDQGCNVNACPHGNHEQCTPLHQAVYMNDAEMIDWLIERGAVATINDPRFDATAIGWARHFGHDTLANRIESKLG